VLVDAVGKPKAKTDWIVREHLQVEGFFILVESGAVVFVLQASHHLGEIVA
jgi:hypothetical protein